MRGRGGGGVWDQLNSKQKAQRKPLVIGVGRSSPLCLELLLSALEGGEVGD